MSGRSSPSSCPSTTRCTSSIGLWTRSARIDYPLELLEIQVLDDSTDETREIAELAVRRQAARGLRHQVHPPNESRRLQGRRARSRTSVGARRVRGDLRRRLRAAERLPATDRAVLPRCAAGGRAGALGAPEPELLAAHEGPGDSARRAFRARAWRSQPLGLLLQLQRHGRRLAARGHRRCRRLAARHADRGPRPQLPGAAARLEVQVPARPRHARGSSGRDERVQVAAAPLGEGFDSDVPQGACRTSCSPTCR